MKALLNRFFAPGINSVSTNFALLLLRLWLGVTMLLNHGWAKLVGFKKMAEQMPDLGLGSTATAGLAVFAEVFCSALLVIGLLTRFAALSLAITMGVAFGMVHKFSLSGDNSGELAFLYLAGYVTLLLAGPGRASVDATLFRKG